jgi:hypothetical protein
MIQYNFTGEPYPSLEEQQRAKQLWLDKLGQFADEFAEKDGIVTFNYSYPATDNRRISFVLGGQHNISDFIRRFNEYIVSIKSDTD